MAINQNRYVDINSVVSGSSIIPERQLIARLFTDNELLPPATFVQFSSAAAVGAYFGTDSEEYARAVYYFSFLSKNGTVPQVISYARWVSAAVAPMVFGFADPANPQALSNYTSITTGSISITLGATTNSFTGIDFSSDLSLADVAATLQTKIRTASGSMWTAATVTYDATKGIFILTGGVTGAAAVSVQAAGSGIDISTLIGWVPAATFTQGAFVNGAIWAAGSAMESITAVLTASSGASNNFGSFAFMPQTPLTLSQNVEAATWNAALNVQYMFMVPVSSANASSWATTLLPYGGTGLTLESSAVNEYPEMLPMMIEASTDYTAANSVQNYEFQQSTLTPSVTDDATADAMDALNINYYGQTQSAGVLVSFYQRGVLMGGITDPLDMNTYANEQWLKNAASAALMNLLIGLPNISANAQGRSQVLATVQSVVNQALLNGTISVAKTLTALQKLAITNITNDPKAWYLVQNNGYWLNCEIVAEGSPVQYVAKYTLVYSKDDVIRKVEGTDVLI